MDWFSFLWLAVTLLILLLVERWIHRHLQGLMLLLTGDPKLAVVLYALPLLPGIALHEISHALTALMLGVRVGGISIGPKLAGRRIQLGFVPVETTDFVRASLIGLAPLLAGSGVILLIGRWIFGVNAAADALVSRNWDALFSEFGRMLRTSDVWFWAYAIFAVGNTMLPSEADRRAWLPVILFLLLAGLGVWVAGWGPAVVEKMDGPLTAALRGLATMCGLVIAADAPFVLAIWLGERLLERVKGMRVAY